MVFRFVLKARNDFEYIGHPSRFVHLFDAAVVVAVFDGEKNDFACSIKAGLSSVLMFIYVSLLGLSFGFKILVPFGRFCVRTRLCYHQFYSEMFHP
jgi:hypothetical protein